MSKTFGPWACIPTSNHAHDYRLTQPNGSSLPVNDGLGTNDHSEQRAIAKLLASAPDMFNNLRYSLASLNFIIEELSDMHLQHSDAYNDACNRANAIEEALSKIIDQ